MAIHIEVGPADAADRLAIRELFDAYAHCADRFAKIDGAWYFAARDLILD
jgi:hypothetical protein